MDTWRSILSWREEELKVGDLLRLAAPENLLKSISLSYDPRSVNAVKLGEVVTVEEIYDDNNAWSSANDYRGFISARGPSGAFWYPYSHWKEFFIKI